MKNIIVKGVLTLCLTGCFTSCNFLDIDSLNSYAEDNVFSEYALTEAYVTKHYTLLRNGFNQNATRMVTDECMCNFNQMAWGYPHDIVNGYMTPDFLGGYDTWSEYYKNIRDCNIFFKNKDKFAQFTKEEQDLLIGEMTFFRAYYYMDLVSRFGGVPYITDVFELDDPNMMLPRNSYEECVEKIAAELKKAAELLPEKQTGENFGRVTKGAALAMRSRLLLYAASPYWNPDNDVKKWELAAEAAKEVLSLDYQLDSDYQGLFLNPHSPEIIFERLYTTEYGAEWVDQKNSPNGMGGWSATCVLQDMVDSYEMEDGTMPDPSKYAIATSDPWKGRDPRFYASIGCDGYMYRNRPLEFWISEDGKKGGQDSKLGDYEGWNATQTGYIMRKFMDEELIPDGTNWTVNSKQPWIYCRLGEIYLNYAEAMYHCGEEGVARFYVNEIRKRARGGRTDILPDIPETVTGNELLEKIQHERKIELAFEEHRFFDIRRWKIAEDVMNKPGKGIMITKKDNGEKSYSIITVQADRKFVSPNHYLLPIPRSEIQKNNLLKQNPGYK